MWNVQFIIIFILYYLIFTVHVFQYIHLYESYFFICYSKLRNYFFKHHIYTTLTIMEVLNYFSKKTSKSHINKLLNLRDLPEAFQHARTASKNTEDYYHISDSQQGYDAFSFNKNNLQKIETEKDLSLITFHEKKTVVGNALKYTKIPEYVKEYSVPKIKLLNEYNHGARPCSVDQIEFGALSLKNYNGLQIVSEKLEIAKFKNPSVTIENYSDIFVKLVLHSKKSGLGNGTIITNSAFEELKWFYHFLESDPEFCSYMNDVLEKNTFFPL